MSPLKRGLTRAALWPARRLGRRPPDAARRRARLLALPMRRLMARRRRIAERNLELCFPDRSARERREMLRGHFTNLAEMAAEMSMAWSRPGRLDERFGSIEGIEHVEAARVRGGVLLVTGHSTCLELGGRMMAEHTDLVGVYRPLRNPELESFQNQGRLRYAKGMLRRDDLRGMIRHLRSGGTLWYAPDQDLGPQRSTFALFFGLQTATANAIVDLARLGRASVVPMYPIKDEATGRVTVYIEPAFENFPSGDAESDLTRFNAFLERWIRQAPAQYYWVHRRFKTTPPGGQNRYPDL